MSEKHRNLPPWMVKPNVQSRKDNEAVRKKTTKRTAKKRLESVVTYWMNERELVETALCLLKDDEAHVRDAPRVPVEVGIIPETDEDMSEQDEQDRTYESNIAEQETVPYGNCVEESTSTKADRHLKPPSEKPDVDYEALKLVREIFFT